MLGCRDESPLTWHPTHLQEQLSEDSVVEAWLLAKLRTGRRGVRTGAVEVIAYGLLAIQDLGLQLQCNCSAIALQVQQRCNCRDAMQLQGWGLVIRTGGS